jgi:hypothetical protein
MASCDDAATIVSELEWQGRVEGDAAKCTAFKDQCLSQSNFWAFAFMKGRSPVVHMAQSIGQFFGMSRLALDVQGKHSGFIGDRVHGRYPIPFLLPPQNAWMWQKTKYVKNTARFTGHHERVENRDKLWATGEGDPDIIEAALPRLLALPMFLAKLLCKQGGTCLPYKLQNYIRDRIDSGAFNFPADKWQLLLDWCLAASQEW